VRGSRWFACLLTGICATVGLSDDAYTAQSESPHNAVSYEAVAPGLLAAKSFAGRLQPGVMAQVQDFIVGPGQSVSDIPTPGVEIVELKSGTIETTLDARVTERRPGNYWIVNPHQKYSLRNRGGVAVLHVVTLTPQ
jgi:hypothetical protein